MSMKMLHDDIYVKILQSWNVTESINKYFKEMINYNNNHKISSEIIYDVDEWKYINHIIMLYGNITESKGIYDWTPTKIGSFLINAMSIHNNSIDPKYDFHLGTGDAVLSNTFSKSITNILNDVFTIPGMNISLSNIAYLFTVNHFQQMIYESATSFEKEETDTFQSNLQDYHSNMPKSFRQCYNQEFERSQNEFGTSENIVMKKYMKKSPCNTIKTNHVCSQYCKWHHYLTNIMMNKEEFQTLMRYALPQSTIAMDLNNQEYQIAGKLFETDKFISNQEFAPAPLIIFCRYEKYQHWNGIDVGVGNLAKFCNDFYPIPSHVGSCITKGIDIGELIKTNNNFSYMKVSKTKLDGGTYLNKATFVIDTNVKGQTPRTMDAHLKEIQMQIHSTKELAQIFHSNQELGTKSVTLEAGHEYTIQVSPTGQIAEDDFQNLDLEQRKCYLDKDIGKDSIFKKYAFSNCMYECNVAIASENCGCIPWDFYGDNQGMPECDVFGRTCFLNTIENVTHFLITKENITDFTKGLCHKCPRACEYQKYLIISTEKHPINTKDNSYFTCRKSCDLEYPNCPCTGKQAFKEFLLDENYTLREELLYEYAERIGNLKFHKIRQASEKQSGLIVVNLHFVTPEVKVDLLTARYTVIDKIASFGGSFGLLTQFTGCSILALIHMLVLFIKELCLQMQKSTTKMKLENQ